MSEKRIPTNLRTLLILEAIGKTDEAITATEINAQIGLPKQTIHRLVNTLTKEGFLVKEPDGKRYRPSRRLRALGAGLLHGSRFNITRHQILKEVAEEVREVVNFVVPEEDGMLYMDRIDADWPLRIQLPVGTNVPFHCTASGKCFMSSLTTTARRRFVAGLNLNKLTEQTHTTKESLLEDLANCRKRGYALDQQEFMPGMVAIAVPVVDERGRFVAALAFHGPSQRVTVEAAVAKRDVLMRGAEKLQKALFTDSEF